MTHTPPTEQQLDEAEAAAARAPLGPSLPTAEALPRDPCWRCGSTSSRIWERTENLNAIRCNECDAYLGNEEHAEGRAMRLFRAAAAAVAAVAETGQ